MMLAIFLSFVLSLSNMAAQNVINVETTVEGTITLQKVSPFPKSIKGILSGYPIGIEIKGLVVFTHARGDTVNSQFIIDYACS